MSSSPAGSHAATHDFVREGEEAEIVPTWIPLDDAVTAVLEGRIANSITAGAVLAAAAAKAGAGRRSAIHISAWTARDTVRGERSK